MGRPSLISSSALSALSPPRQTWAAKHSLALAAATAQASPACSSRSASPAPPPPPSDATESAQSCWRSIRRTASAHSSPDASKVSAPLAWPCRPCATRPRVPATRLDSASHGLRVASLRDRTRCSWKVGARWPPLPHAVEKATTGCSRWAAGSPASSRPSSRSASARGGAPRWLVGAS